MTMSGSQACWTPTAGSVAQVPRTCWPGSDCAVARPLSTMGAGPAFSRWLLRPSWARWAGYTPSTSSRTCSTWSTAGPQVPGTGISSPSLAPGKRVPLSDQIANWAICVQVLHYPQQLAGRIDMVGDIARLLAPEGRVLIVNWIPQTGDDGSRLSAAETQKMLRQAGFEPDEPQPLGEKQYTITARRLAAQRVPG